MIKTKINKKTDLLLQNIKECNKLVLQHTKYPRCVDKADIFTTLFKKLECVLAVTKNINCYYYSDVSINIDEIKHICCIFDSLWCIIDYTEFQIEKYSDGYCYTFLVSLVSEKTHMLTLSDHDYNIAWVLLPKQKLLGSLIMP